MPRQHHRLPYLCGAFSLNREGNAILKRRGGNQNQPDCLPLSNMESVIESAHREISVGFDRNERP